VVRVPEAVRASGMPHGSKSNRTSLPLRDGPRERADPMVSA